MKQICNLIVVLFIPLFVMASDVKYAHEKEKTISKTFETSAEALTQISNSYGNINVYLWNENKVAIQVKIKVSGNNEAKVIERLNGISAAIDGNASKVSAKTTFSEKNWSTNNMNYEINYIVKIPRNGNINLTNKYGNIAVENLNGTATIDCQYGSVTLGTFKNKSNSITLAYSQNSSIEFIENVQLKSSYSKIDCKQANQVTFNGNYNTFTTQNTKILQMATNYTKVTAKNIQKLAVDGNYLTLNFGEISQSATIDSNYSNIQMTMTSKTDQLLINGNYSHSKISCAPDAVFDFDFMVGYGSFKEELGLKYTEKYEKNTSKSYSGYFNNPGKSKIKITTNYGNIQLLKL